MDTNLIRQQVRAARAALSKEQRAAFSKQIVDNLVKLSEYQNSRIIFLYRAMQSEASLATLLTDPSVEAKVLCYPRCLPDRQMQALVPSAGWQKSNWGIWEPIPETSSLILPPDIDLILVPLVAFDSQCQRIGMGGGYYDRYLPQCPQATKIGIAFELQKVAFISPEPWDQQLDLVVTEKTIYGIDQVIR